MRWKWQYTIYLHIALWASMLLAAVAVVACDVSDAIRHFHLRIMLLMVFMVLARHFFLIFFTKINYLQRFFIYFNGFSQN